MQAIHFFTESTLQDYKRRVQRINQEAWKYQTEAGTTESEKHPHSLHISLHHGHKRRVAH
jgi:hypothetical protein